jgi:hypothetical protein
MKEIFSKSQYKTDLIENTMSKTPHAMQAIKYKLEAFTPECQTQYAKDLTKYSGMLQIISF